MIRVDLAARVLVKPIVACPVRTPIVFNSQPPVSSEFTRHKIYMYQRLQEIAPIHVMFFTYPLISRPIRSLPLMRNHHLEEEMQGYLAIPGGSATCNISSIKTYMYHCHLFQTEKTAKNSPFWALFRNYLENGGDSCFTTYIFGCPSLRYIMMLEVPSLYNKYFTFKTMNGPKSLSQKHVFCLFLPNRRSDCDIVNT